MLPKLVCLFFSCLSVTSARIYKRHDYIKQDFCLHLLPCAVFLHGVDDHGSPQTSVLCKDCLYSISLNTCSSKHLHKLVI